MKLWFNLTFIRIVSRENLTLNAQENFGLKNHEFAKHIVTS
jgi:hypothetical protein